MEYKTWTIDGKQTEVYVFPFQSYGELTDTVKLESAVVEGETGLS